LIGNGGNDLLIGGAGRDLVIGGAGQDEIHGQEGEDLLIGGTTTYDGDLVSLGAIRREWTRQDLSYQQRVDHLMNGGGHNGGVVLTSKTVLADGAVDQLFGEGDRDWFWHDPTDLLDAVPGELTEIAGS